MALRRSLDVNLANERAEDQAAEDQEEPRLMYKMKSAPSKPQRFVEKMRSLFSGESSDSEDADFSADSDEDEDLGDMVSYFDSPDEAKNESLSAPKFEVRHRLEAHSEGDGLCYAAQLPPSPMQPIRLEIVSVTGLEAEAIASLTKHLQSLQLPGGVSGELVWELRITNGQVKQVILDDEQSSGDDPELIEVIRRSLFTWRGVRSLSTTVLLRVRISA
jgi:Ca-activated chloride channel family protein